MTRVIGYPRPFSCRCRIRSAAGTTSSPFLVDARSGLISVPATEAEIFAETPEGVNATNGRAIAFATNDGINHLHLLSARPRPRRRQDLVRRRRRKQRKGKTLCHPRDKSRKPLPVSKDWVEMKLKDARWVAAAREQCAKPELVHEVLEGTTRATCQSPRPNAWHLL